MYITRVKSESSPLPLILCGENLPWMDNLEHLGQTLTNTLSMNLDCRRERTEFIDSSMKTREFFEFAHPCEVVSAIEKYSCSFCGSDIWNLKGEAAESVYASWRTSVKLAWNLPCNCYSYFIDALLATDTLAPKVGLLLRFHRFFHSLLASPSHKVTVVARLVAQDLRSTTGASLASLQLETGLDPWLYGGHRLKDSLTASNRAMVPEGEEWRILYLQSLLTLRMESFYEGNVELESHYDELIQCLITN